MTSLVLHNPGITSRQICATLGLLLPILVAKGVPLMARLRGFSWVYAISARGYASAQSLLLD